MFLLLGIQAVLANSVVFTSGDISRNEWTSRIVGEAGYSYFYDGADRLAEAQYSGDGHYSSGYSYDAAGNLTGIVRIGTEVDGRRPWSTT